MGDVASGISGCSCELFSTDTSPKSRNKYTTTDTESIDDASSNNESCTDDNQYNNQYKSIKTSLETTTTKTQFIKHIEKQNVFSNKLEKIKKNQSKATTTKKNNPDTPIPKSKYKSKKRNSKTKHKKKKKKKNKLKLERSKSYNQVQSPHRPKLHIHQHSEPEVINNDLLSPQFTFMNHEFEAFMRNITNNHIESKQTDNIPLSPPHKRVSFVDNNNNNNMTSPKLNFIDETSDNMDNRFVIYPTIDNENDSCKSFDNISIKSSNTLPMHNNIIYNNNNNNRFPNTNLSLIRSQSVGPPTPDLNLQDLERRYSYTLTPSVHYNNTPIMTPYTNNSDSIPSQLPQYPSFTHSNSIPHPSQRNSNSNSYGLNIPPSKVLHNYSCSFDATTIINDNTGVNLNKRRKSKPTKVCTPGNSGDWSVDRIVSENDAMTKQLLFLKRYNSEKESNNNTHWIDKNYNM